MKRTRKLALALSTSAVLALGAVAPALAGPPPNQGTNTACAAFGDSGAQPAAAAYDAIGCLR